MDRREIHRRFLSCLLSLRNDGIIQGVRVVARLYNDEWLGGFSPSPAYLFIPDLHLTSQEAEGRYKYGFRTLQPGRSVPRDTVLAELCRRERTGWGKPFLGRTAGMPSASTAPCGRRSNTSRCSK